MIFATKPIPKNRIESYGQKIRLSDFELIFLKNTSHIYIQNREYLTSMTQNEKIFKKPVLHFSRNTTNKNYQSKEAVIKTSEYVRYYFLFLTLKFLIIL